MTAFDVAEIRKRFPIYDSKVNGLDLIYLDSAGTSQKPREVLDAINALYTEANANVHRGAYYLSDQASRRQENARKAVADFIGARSKEVIFTKNATEALNLVAFSWGRANLTAEDSIVLSVMEHHANIVPWQILASQIGFEIRWLPLSESATIDLSHLDELLRGTKLISITAMSNVVGSITDMSIVVEAAKKHGALVCVDACQLVPHMACDVSSLGIDFMAFSGHKMCGPSGVGVLWARQELLEAMPPFIGGGGMIETVTTEGFSCAEIPYKFEAGTPPIAQIVGLGAAVGFLKEYGMDQIRKHEIELSGYLIEESQRIHGDALVLHGPNDPTIRGGAFSFRYKDVHPHDISQVLDSKGVAVRAGHHCAKPLMQHLNVASSARASLYLYNDTNDIDIFLEALKDADTFFAF